MRCSNCGWDNVSVSSYCLKCNTLLGKTSSEARKSSLDTNEFDKTINDKEILPPQQKEYAFAKTLNETGYDSTDNNEEKNDILITCSNKECSYLNASDAIVCSKCKLPLYKISKPVKQDEVIFSSTIYENELVNTSFIDTINSYQVNGIMPDCNLSLILTEKEQQLGSSLKTERNFKFDNSAIQLNRKNLDENNSSISIKDQAELFFENGKWYLLNKSAAGTTFVLAKEKIEIKEGDVLLMGNRKFIFLAPAVS